MSGLLEKLLTRFGLGENPMQTRRLYARIERQLDKHGEPVRTIINDIAMSSNGKDDPGRYFRKIVRLRMMEMGYWDSAYENPKLAILTVAELKQRVLELQHRKSESRLA